MKAEDTESLAKHWTLQSETALIISDVKQVWDTLTHLNGDQFPVPPSGICPCIIVLRKDLQDKAGRLCITDIGHAAFYVGLVPVISNSLCCILSGTDAMDLYTMRCPFLPCLIASVLDEIILFHSIHFVTPFLIKQTALTHQESGQLHLLIDVMIIGHNIPIYFILFLHL